MFWSDEEELLVHYASQLGVRQQAHSRKVGGKMVDRKIVFFIVSMIILILFAIYFFVLHRIETGPSRKNHVSVDVTPLGKANAEISRLRKEIERLQLLVPEQSKKSKVTTGVSPEQCRDDMCRFSSKFEKNLKTK